MSITQADEVFGDAEIPSDIGERRRQRRQIELKQCAADDRRPRGWRWLPSSVTPV